MHCLPCSPARGFLFALVIGGGLAACSVPVDLTAVQKYATVAQQARSSFDALASDYDASCERQRELVNRSNDLSWIPPVPGLEANVDPSVSPSNAVRVANAPPTPFFGQQSQEYCVVTGDRARYPLGAVSEDWSHANDALLAYIQSLGAIANVSVEPTDIPALTGAATSAHLISATQATAIEGFGKQIISFWKTGAKRHDIVTFLEVVNTADPSTGRSPFAEAIDALQAAGTAYTGTLIFNECTETNNLYISALKTLSSQAMAHPDALIRIRAYRMRTLWRAELATCVSRQAAGRAYLATLTELASTNAALLKAERQPDTSRAALLQNIEGLSTTISTLYALVASFKPVAKGQ